MHNITEVSRQMFQNTSGTKVDKVDSNAELGMENGQNAGVGDASNTDRTKNAVCQLASQKCGKTAKRYTHQNRPCKCKCTYLVRNREHIHDNVKNCTVLLHLK